MATRLEKFMQDPEFKTAVTSLQTEVFDLTEPKQYQQFMNAIAVLMNKGFAEGFSQGVDRVMQDIKNIRPRPNPEGIMSMDHRDLERIDQLRQHTQEHPEAPLDSEIDNLHLTMRAYNDLKRADIHTVADLVGKTESEVMHLLHRSASAERILLEVKDQLAEYGYVLRQDTSDAQPS